MTRILLSVLPQLDLLIFEGVAVIACAIFIIGLFLDAEPHDEFLISELEFKTVAEPVMMSTSIFIVFIDTFQVLPFINKCLMAASFSICSPLDQFVDACAGFIGLNGDSIGLVPLSIILLIGGIDETVFSEKESSVESDRGVLGNIEGYDAVLEMLFSIVVAYNLVGLLPYQFTSTSHIAVAFTLSFGIFISLNIIGAAISGLKVFRIFFPKGVPIHIGPFLVLIELVSYLSRGFSLGIRLFANIISGHALLKILASFS